MNKKIKLIIFDAYGVFLFGGYKQTAELLAKKFGMNDQNIYDVMYKKYFNQAALKKITQDEAWEKAIQELNLPISIAEIKKIHYSFIRLNQPIVNLAKKLSKEYQILLLSKNTGPQFKDAMDLIPEIKQVFRENIINTWDYNLPKASQETIEMVLNKYQVKPEATVYIDDQMENLVEAKKMGVYTIFYVDFDQVAGELNKILN